MTAAEFLSQLSAQLRFLPEEERENALAYYREYFEEAGPEHEAEAAERLGSPQSAAERIIKEVGTSGAAQYTVPADTYQPQPGAERSGSGGHIALGIVLIAVTFPLWITVLSVWVGLAAAVIGCLLGFAAAGIGAPIQGILNILAGAPWYGMYEIGGGLLCLGLALLLWKPAFLLIKWSVKLIGKGVSAFFGWMSGKGTKV